MLKYLLKNRDKEYGIWDSDDMSLEFVTSRDILELLKLGYTIDGIQYDNGRLLSRDINYGAKKQALINSRVTYHYVLLDGMIHLDSIPETESIYIEPFVNTIASGMFKKLLGYVVSGGSGLIDTSCMFFGNKNIRRLDITGLDTSNVTTMSSMFGNCSMLRSIDVSYMDTSKVIDMNRMFYGCTSLRIVDCSNFDMSGVKDFDNIFYACPANVLLPEGFDESSLRVPL